MDGIKIRFWRNKNMSNWVELKSRDLSHLVVQIKNKDLLDVSIFDRMSNDDYCLPCMLRDSNMGVLSYSLQGFIPLEDFLNQYVFEKEEGYLFLHALFEQAISSNRNKPILFEPEYVYVSKYGDHFGFIAIPIKVDAWMFQREMCSKWIEYIARHIKTNSAFELIGFLISFLNSDEFSLPNLVLGLDNIKNLYYPKKRFSFHKRAKSFKVKEPIQALYQPQIQENDDLEKTQFLNVETHFCAYLEFDNQKYTLNNEVNLIGRAYVCDIRFDDPSVSLKHCKITCVDERYYIQDLKSTNKTFIGEKEVKRKMRLKNDMKLQFGDVVCVFKQQ